MAGRRGFLEHRRILLGDLVQVVDRRIDLVQPGGLFAGRGRDGGDPFRNVDNRGHDFPKGVTGAVYQIDA